MSYSHALALSLSVCLSGAAWPQSAPSTQPAPIQPIWEAGASYAYNSVLMSGTSSNQSGGSVYGEYFLKGTRREWGGQSRWGVAGEFSGSGSNSGGLFTYLFGPRWGVEWRHVYFYGGVSLGGDRVRVSREGGSGTAAPFIRNGFATSFATTGVDLLFGSHFVVKLLQADDLAFEVPDFMSGQSHWRGGLRASGGFAVRFGQR